MGFYVGFDRDNSSDTFRLFWQNWLPDHQILELDQALDCEQPWPTLVFERVENTSEFPVCFDIVHLDGLQDEIQTQKMAVETARRMSQAWHCKSICEGTMFGEKVGFPGYALVWSENQPILADDYGTDFGDGEGGPVRKIKDLHLDIKSLSNEFEQFMARYKKS